MSNQAGCLLQFHNTHSANRIVPFRITVSLVMSVAILRRRCIKIYTKLVFASAVMLFGLASKKCRVSVPPERPAGAQDCSHGRKPVDSTLVASLAPAGRWKVSAAPRGAGGVCAVPTGSLRSPVATDLGPVGAGLIFSSRFLPLPRSSPIIRPSPSTRGVDHERS